MASTQKPKLEFLQGQIERITYTNEENGYTVAKVKVRGRRDLVTVIGHMTSPLPGQVLTQISFLAALAGMIACDSKRLAQIIL